MPKQGAGDNELDWCNRDKLKIKSDFNVVKLFVILISKSIYPLLLPHARNIDKSIYVDSKINM